MLGKLWQYVSVDHMVHARQPGIRMRNNRKPYRIPYNTILTLNAGILSRHYD